jgi:hypothetical protein
LQMGGHRVRWMCPLCCVRGIQRQDLFVCCGSAAGRMKNDLEDSSPMAGDEACANGGRP